MSDIKLQNNYKKLNKKSICSNIIKTEMQSYKREVLILLYIVLNFKSKYIIKGAIAQMERKLGKLTCESNSSEDPNIKNQKLKQAKRKCRKPLEKLKHLKIKNKNFYNLFRSLTWQI